ncbi:MAG: DUF5343 domain-containing protein [Candidatus Dormiibacterota bacterium]
MSFQIEDQSKRPYAAAANVLAVLNRARTRNLPDTINGEFYRLCGIGEAVHGRVAQALTFLGLIDGNGAPQNTLRAMTEAPEAEFKDLLATAIREAYAAEFDRVDPAQDSQATVADAFRRYAPKSQIDRMVMLFLGLCREAGIPVKDVPRDRKMTSTPATRKAAPGQRTEARKASSTPPAPPVQESVGGLYGFSEADLGALSEQDFQQLWTALGKAARAKALRLSSPPPDVASHDDSVGEEESQGE